MNRRKLKRTDNSTITMEPQPTPASGEVPRRPTSAAHHNVIGIVSKGKGCLHKRSQVRKRG